MWKALSISFKIWLSITILVVGYFVSMVVGYGLALRIEARLLQVSETLVPSARYSQFASVSFKEQMRLYQDAVLSGEGLFVDSANTKAIELRQALQSIVLLDGLNEKKKEDVIQLLKLHELFTQEANQLYFSMSSLFDEEKAKRMTFSAENPWYKSAGSLMTARVDALIQRMKVCADAFSRDLTIELEAISRVTKRQRILNAFLFIVVVVVGLTLMGLIISRSISRPLRKTFMLENAVKQSIDGIAVLDLNGYIQFCNHAWAKMHGYALDEIPGKHLSFFLEETHGHSFLPIFKTVQQKGAYKGEFYHRNKESTLFPSTMTINLLKERGVEASLVIIARDITDQKQHERELFTAKEKAEKVNAALEESLIMLKRTQDHLVQSEKMVALGGLVAGVAHEINTPVGVGVTASSFLEDQTKSFRERFEKNGLRRSDIENYLKLTQETSSMILSNLMRAAELIQSFKQVAVDQSGEEKRLFNMKAYLSSVLVSLHPKYRRSGHTITLTCPDHIEINNYPGAFSQIITNLIMNSLIHGFDGIEKGKIDIDVEIKEALLLISYRDNGRGMEAGHLRKIYDPFFTTKRSHGGTGLGMHIVFNLVTQQLNGTIECSSRIGEGILFLIKIPVEMTMSRMG